jgi:hypothetical protein
VAAAACVPAAAPAMLRERTRRHDGRHGECTDENAEFSNHAMTLTFHNITGWN